jgi:alcohol dehydrogenase
VIPFDYQPRTRIVFAPGAVERLAELAGELAARRALVVSDPGVVAAGHVDRALDVLRAAQIAVELFTGVGENPSTEHVATGLEVARRFAPDLLIGLGGGSAMDCAKGINFLLTNGGRIEDYWGVGKASRPMLPMLAVPTTAGTGSEAQSFALISHPVTHVKMACGDVKAACRAAILDPRLTLTQPPRVTALTGIDAVAHALETYVTTKRNSMSLAFSRESWRLLAANFVRVLDEPDNLEARGGMQLGACFAGMAIETSMLGAAHALANPLTSQFHVPHGQAVSLMLPHVIRFNGATSAAAYHELWQLTPEASGARDDADAVRLLAERVTGWVRRAGLAVTLDELDVPGDRLAGLAAEAARQWTGGFNPRRVGEEDFRGIYEAALR